MIHDPILPPLATCPHLGRDFIQSLVPTDALPLSFAPLANPFEGIEDPFGVVNLVVGGRAFGAVAAPAAGMDRVALELLDFQRCFIHVGQQAAGAFAVEADGRYQHIAVGHLPRPFLAAVLHPIVPIFRRRVLAHPAVRVLDFNHLNLLGVDLGKAGQRFPGHIRYTGRRRPFPFRRRAYFQHGT